MKKTTLLITVIALIGILAGCELFNHTYYFYSWAEDGQEPTYTLNYRKEGYTIIMSRGRGDDELTKSEAEGLIGQTTFSLELSNTALIPIDEKGVAKLDGGWHVVQTFKTGALSRGTHTLVGTSVLTGADAGTRVNTVHLTIR